jgi:uncharacterized integral membrane protein
MVARPKEFPETFMDEVLGATSPVARIQRGDPSMQSFLIAALAIAILTVIFALQNTTPVLVTFMFWKFEGSLALVLMLTFALGVLASLMVSIPAMLKRRAAISNQKKNVQEAER